VTDRQPTRSLSHTAHNHKRTSGCYSQRGHPQIFDGRETRHDILAALFIGTITNALGNAVRYGYTLEFELQQITDAGGCVSHYARGARQQVTAVWRNGSLRDRYEYTVCDQLAVKYDRGGTRLFTSDTASKGFVSREALVPFGWMDTAAKGDRGELYVMFTNSVGVPVLVEDEAGRTVWRAERVNAHGMVTVAEGATVRCDLRWPGQWYDEETGLQYNRFRYWDPRLGRYVQSDPKGTAGGLNVYAGPKNPTVHVDLLGLTTIKCDGGAAPHNADKAGGPTANPCHEEVADPNNPEGAVSMSAPTPRTTHEEAHTLNGEAIFQEAVRNAGLEEYLRKNPLREVEYIQGALLTEDYRGRLVRSNGEYFPGLANVALSMDRPPSTYGDSFANGRPESIGSCGVGSVDAIQRTATHELGHHVREKIGGTMRTELETLWQQETEAGRHITDYAGSSYEEYFAESFTAYHYHPTELEERSPATATFILNAMIEAYKR
jgi:RHS repeat-associated protein